MSGLVAGAYGLWLVVSLLLFRQLGAARGAMACAVFGWLFLPVGVVPVPGLPDVDKISAISYCLLLGSVFTARERFFRAPGLIDLPMLVWIASAGISSLTNDRGSWDAFSAVYGRLIPSGVSYWVGRTLLSDRQGLTALVRTVAIGGLVYVPFCLFEVRFSPQLHHWLYGYHQHDFLQTIRGSSFRPMVFVDSSLVLSLWMANATLACFCLRRERTRLLGLTPMAAFAILLATTMLCRSVGTYLLLGVALLLMLHGRPLPWRLLLASVPCYLFVRVAFPNALDPIAAFFEQLSPDRGNSLLFRWSNEKLLLSKALQQPLFGWTRWDLPVVQGADGALIETTVDSLWIIALLASGLVSLGAWVLMFMTAAWRATAAILAPHGPRSVVVATGLIVTVYLCDQLQNNFTVPVYYLALGAILPGVAMVAGTEPARVLAAVPLRLQRRAHSASLARRSRRALDAFVAGSTAAAGPEPAGIPPAVPGRLHRHAHPTSLARPSRRAPAADPRDTP